MIVSCDTVFFKEISLGAHLIANDITAEKDTTTSWSIAVWGPHISSASVLLKSGYSEREIGMFKGKGDTWAVLVSQCPSVEELERGKLKYQFILESSWNDCFHTEGTRLYRRNRLNFD